MQCPVVLVRRIASYVGGETEYNTVWGAIGHIYKTEGVPGFFKVPSFLSLVRRGTVLGGQGLAPQLLGEWGTIWVTGALVLAIDRAFLALGADQSELEELEEPEDGEDAKQRISGLVSVEGPGGLGKLAKFGVPFFVNSLVYHYHLISTLVTVNDVGLAAGLFPYAPPFASWQGAYDFLQATVLLLFPFQPFQRHCPFAPGPPRDS